MGRAHQARASDIHFVVGHDITRIFFRIHGLLTAAENPYRAFHLMYMLERACQAQVKALSTGQALTRPPEAVCTRASAQFAAEDDDAYVRKVWDAAVLLIEAQLADCCR